MAKETMSDVKKVTNETNKKVKTVHFHQGINFMWSGIPVVQTLDAVKHSVELELLPMGVRIRKDGKEFVVPVGIIHLIETFGYDA